MGTLQEPASDPLEEHLLICEMCQDRLRFLAEFIAATRAAATRITEFQDRHTLP